MSVETAASSAYSFHLVSGKPADLRFDLHLQPPASNYPLPEMAGPGSIPPFN
jgi:hypothetical protein